MLTAPISLPKASQEPFSKHIRLKTPHTKQQCYQELQHLLPPVVQACFQEKAFPFLESEIFLKSPFGKIALKLGGSKVQGIARYFLTLTDALPFPGNPIRLILQFSQPNTIEDFSLQDDPLNTMGKLLKNPRKKVETEGLI